MSKSNISTQAELPSTKKLIQSTILAAATAGVLLITVVMPAEYGIDPTGIGNIIGLKKMGEIRVSLDKEAKADQAKNSGTNTAVKQNEVNTAIASTPQSTSIPQSTGTGATSLNHEMQFTLAPDEGVEIKADMSKGNKLQYVWSTNGGKANFDVHADSKELGIDYHAYGKGSEQRKEGEIEAAFNGSHGWFWRNRTSSPMVITLKTQGEYTAINRK